MNRCYLGLGSNQKSPERQLRRAIQLIRAAHGISITQVSSFYWNKAWGVLSQQNFCNAVIEIHTTLRPMDLLKICQQIELKQGRVRKKRWGPRVIDIDIILYHSLTVKSPKLTIPHLHLLSRDFVVGPLSELNPSYMQLIDHNKPSNVNKR